MLSLRKFFQAHRLDFEDKSAKDKLLSYEER